MEKQSIGKLAVKGGLWVFSIQAITRILTITKLIIVARILAPQDFGTMGIALLTLSILDVFSKTGFFEKLIQEKSDITEYLDTAWSILLIRGIILSTIIFFISNPIAIFFRNPEAAKVIKLLAISPILTGAVNIGIVYFQRELQFQKQFIYDVCGAITNFVVVIVSAIILRNVIALVIGIIAENAVRFIVSFLLSPYRPKFKTDLKALKKMYKFGRWIFGSSILVFALTQGDDIFVGKVLGAFSLGLYQMAYRISNLPATQITHVISKVTFPAYSRLQNEIPKMKETYLKVLRLTLLFSCPISALIFTLGYDFTLIFLGDKWTPMVPALMTLCIFGIIRTINATAGPIFNALGKPKVNTLGSSIQLIIFIAIIYPLSIKWGILGTSIATIIPNLFFMIYITIKIKKMLDLKILDLLLPVLIPFIGAITIPIIIFLCKHWGWNSISLLNFVIFLTLGIFIYIAVIFTANKVLPYRVIDDLRYLYTKFKGNHNEHRLTKL